jgi:hypothetical protein
MKFLPWALLAAALAMAAWLALALVNAENQRNALMTKACADPVSKGDTDRTCLAKVQTRPSWWQHFSYAMTHVHP